MEIDIHFEVIEYSNEGFGRLHHHFPTLDEAKAWVDQAQAEADKQGNPKELCYDVVPAGNAVYSSVSKVTALDAAA